MASCRCFAMSCAAWIHWSSSACSRSSSVVSGRKLALLLLAIELGLLLRAIRAAAIVFWSGARILFKGGVPRDPGRAALLAGDNLAATVSTAERAGLLDVLFIPDPG